MNNKEAKRKQSNDLSLFSPDQTMNIQFHSSTRKKIDASEKSGFTNKSKYTNNSKLLKSQLFSTISRNNNKFKSEQTMKERDIQIELLEGSLANLNNQEQALYQKIHESYKGWA